MCHSSCLEFGRRCLTPDEVRSRHVLEVGSQNVNGSLRPWIEAGGPAQYLGIDLEPGPGVDEICDVTGLIRRFGPDCFDIVIATEVLEHVRNWRAAVHNMKGVLKPGGYLLVTTRSLGFPYHGWPQDYWRYEAEDILRMFNDSVVLKLEKDPETPGILLFARLTPAPESDLRPIALHSIIANRRIRHLTWLHVWRWRRWLRATRTSERRS